MKKERPILFSTPMVIAIKEGRKTVTRRTRGFEEINKNTDAYKFDGLGIHPPTDTIYATFIHKKSGENFFVKSPYGKPGDGLWVRETFTKDFIGARNCFVYLADGDEDCRWTPCIHMPRRASRIDLEVADLCVERLHHITNAEAIAEGISDKHKSPRTGFEDLWKSINGKDSWDKNPFVWVVSFVKVRG